MEDPWAEIDGMVSELGEFYALEVEASAFPELNGDPAIEKIHIAVLRATEEVRRVASAHRDHRLDHARDALFAARSSADAARLLIVRARASRNRDH